MASNVKVSKNYKWGILAMVVVIYVVCYGYVATALSSLLTTISAELGWTLVESAAVVGALPLGITCFTFVSGILLDKISTRVLLCITIIICAIAIFMRGVANSFSTFYAAMFILGVGQAVLFPGVVKVITTWFTREELFRANGIVVSGAPIGMILGFNTSIPISNAIGWHNLFRIVGVIGIVVAIVWLIIAKDVKASDVALNQQIGVDTEKNSIWDNLKGVLAQKQTWCLILAEFFYQGMIQTMIAFGASVIVTFPGATPQIAAFVSSLGNLGSLFGYYVLPPISDRFGIRKPFVWTSMIINTIFLLSAYFSGNLVVAGICFFVGYFFNGWSVSGPRTMLQESPGIAGLRAGTAMGALTTMSRLAAAVYPFLYAAVAGVTTPIIGICVVACSALVASICVILAKETGIGREAAQKRLEEKKAAKANHQ